MIAYTYKHYPFKKTCNARKSYAAKQKKIFAKCVRVSRGELPQNVRLARKYVQKIVPRRRRKRRGEKGGSFAIPSQAILSTALEMGKKAGKTDSGR